MIFTNKKTTLNLLLLFWVQKTVKKDLQATNTITYLDQYIIEHYEIIYGEMLNNVKYSWISTNYLN